MWCNSSVAFKLLPDITAKSSGREKAEIIVILASGKGGKFIFGVFKIESSSGTDQTNAYLFAINVLFAIKNRGFCVWRKKSKTGLQEDANFKILENLLKYS